MIDILAILLALGLLMYLAFRGVTLLVLAPGMALLAALLTGGLPLLAAYTQIFMTNTGDFIIAFFPLFMLGAIFHLREADGRQRLGPVHCTISHRLAWARARNRVGRALLRRVDLWRRVTVRRRLCHLSGGGCPVP
jgi:hypothetical protein